MEKCSTARSASSVTAMLYSGHSVTSFTSWDSRRRVSSSRASPSAADRARASVQSITGGGGSRRTRWKPS